MLQHIFFSGSRQEEPESSFAGIPKCVSLQLLQTEFFHKAVIEFRAKHVLELRPYVFAYISGERSKLVIARNINFDTVFLEILQRLFIDRGTLIEQSGKLFRRGIADRALIFFGDLFNVFNER